MNNYERQFNIKRSMIMTILLGAIYTLQSLRYINTLVFSIHYMTNIRVMHLLFCSINDYNTNTLISIR